MKKKFNFKAAVFGAAVLAAGACVSAPALVPSTVMAATEAVEATESTKASERITVSRTIRYYYKLDDGSTKPVKSSDGGDFKITRYAIFTAGDKSTVELAGYESPVISGYTPDKSYVEPVKVTAESKPADVIVYYTQNPENKKTYETESRTLSRKITFYTMRDDGQAVQTYQKTQSATVNRIVTIDGNGKRTEGEWQDVTFSGEAVPAMKGYTPSLQEVPTVTVTPDNPPQDVNVYYKKNLSDQDVKDEYTGISRFSVTFTDGLGNTLKTQSVNAGTSATAPAAPKREGYTFDGWDKSFNSVKSNLTVNAKWKANKTEIVNDSKTVRRTISYYYTDGKPVISTNGGPASEYYQWTFNRTGIKDTVTGKINWSDWSAATTFPEKKVMDYPGYTPNIATVPAQVVNHNSKSWEIKVYYKKNGSNSDVVDTYTGVRYQNNAWRYVKNGKFDSSFTGVAKSTSGNWVFVKNGVFNEGFTGVARSTTGNWVFVRNGRYSPSYTGVAQSTTGNWIFVRNGRFNTAYTGVAQSTTGNWIFVRNGRFTTSYTGVAQSTTGSWIFVRNGRYSTKFTGVVQSTTGNWIYVRNGRFMPSYSGVAKDINGRTVNVRNGRLV